MDNSMLSLFNKNAEAFGVSVNAETWEKFELYARLLKEWNEKMNLTAITDDEGITVKHFADSASAVPFILKNIKDKDNFSIADVGTGAGFPGIPLKLLLPGARVTLIDSLEKRLVFLNTVINELGLTNIKTVHLRAEDAGRDAKLRDKFTVVTARAVAAMPVLLEYCMPLCAPNGVFVAMKGTKQEEFTDRALKELSAKLISRNEFELSIPDSGRTIYCFRKTGYTDKKYPRQAGTPSKKPLN